MAVNADRDSGVAFAGAIVWEGLPLRNLQCIERSNCKFHVIIVEKRWEMKF